MNKALPGRWAVVLGVAMLLAACERPPMDSSQSGYRGTAMGQVSNPRLEAVKQEAQPLPAPVPELPSPPGSPLAKDVYKNVKVLGDLPVGEFTRTMLAMSNWVAPKQQCVYCHAPGEDMSSDKLYTKVVARRMIQMTQHINSDWAQHVGKTGVTCYSCHRGEPVPSQAWFQPEPLRSAGGATAESGGHNHPSRQAGLSAIDVDVLSRYLVGPGEPLRTAGTQALPYGNPATIKQTENVFGLMVHMSQSLGVNCTHCHNTRSHAQWQESPLTRTTAFHGIRMAQDINNAYLLPLTDTFPADRLGPNGDVAKVSCATCHQGLSKPLNGAPLLKDHPVLAKQTALATAAAAPAASLAVPAGTLGAVYFAVDQAGLDEAARRTITEAVARLKAESNTRLTLSGYADSSGSRDRNLDLAKQRALAVREALTQAGLDPQRIALKKPEFAEAGQGGQARRVDLVPTP